MASPQESENIPQEDINAWYSFFAPFYNLAIRWDEIPNARRSLIDLVALTDGERSLEVAVGTGRNLQYYPSTCEAWGIDINEKMLARAKKRAKRKPHIRLELGNAHDLPYGTDSFDAGILTFALSGIPDNALVLDELVRVVRPGGRIGILDFPYREKSFFGGVAGVELSELLHDRADFEIMQYECLRTKRVFRDGLDRYLLEVK